MKPIETIWQKFTEETDLLGEIMPGTPLVEIAGDHRVILENHRGILCYSHREIRVKVKFGQICVCGCNLELTQMTKEQLVITGHIDGIHLSRG